MAHRVPRSRTALAVGLGALLAPVLFTGAAAAHTGDGGGDGITPIPPVAPVQVTVLARGAAGELAISDEQTGFHLRADRPTDVVMVQATVPPHSSTGWHTHAGPSTAVVASGAVRLIEPEDGHGCTEETLPAGTAWVHPKHVHDIANDGAQPAVVYLTYYLPAGASPALVPADPPHGC
ncbi:hypothetical protein ACI8AA_07155 [Geodermatophilus sp. SYSU D01180]